VTPTGTAAVTATVTVATTARKAAFAPPSSESRRLGHPLSLYFSATLCLWIAIIVGSFWSRDSRWRLRRAPAWAFAAVLAAAITIASCGGGSTTGGSGQVSGTLAGTYTIVVSASSAGSATVAHNMNFTLIVQ
jgi:hypothetical protein